MTGETITRHLEEAPIDLEAAGCLPWDVAVSVGIGGTSIYVRPFKGELDAGSCIRFI